MPPPSESIAVVTTAGHPPGRGVGAAWGGDERTLRVEGRQVREVAGKSGVEMQEASG